MNPDRGFYRRLNIIPFDKRISEEEEKNFDKSKILNQEAIDYFANISLRAYLKIINSGQFSNFKENEELIENYKRYNDSISNFLSEEEEKIFNNKKVIKRTELYELYENWCVQKKYSSKNRKEFYNNILANEKYKTTKINGCDAIKKIA